MCKNCPTLEYLTSGVHLHAISTFRPKLSSKVRGIHDVQWQGSSYVICMNFVIGTAFVWELQYKAKFISRLQIVRH